MTVDRRPSTVDLSRSASTGATAVIRACVLAAGALVTVAPLAAQMPVRDFDRYVTSTLQRFQTPAVAVAIVKDGKIVLARGYGIRKMGEPTPADSHTRFGIASNTKAFTALALGLLVEEGKVEWDAPVIRYLPWFQMWDPWVTREMTVRDLLVHRSGLGLGAGDLMWWPASTWPRDSVARRLRYIPPARSFRSGYAYDNVLYLVAGEVIEAVSGKSWEDFVTERLLRPVGMTDATVHHSDAGDPNADQAATHAVVDGRMQPIEPFLSDNTNPAGGINASAEDMAHWLLAQLDSGMVNGQRLWKPGTTRAQWSLVTPINPGRAPAQLAPRSTSFNGYGLGFFIQDYRGMKIVTHTGGLPGYLSRVIMVPDRRIGVAVLSNAESEAFEAIAWQAVDMALGAPKFDWAGGYAWAAARADSMNAAAERSAATSRDSMAGPALPLDRYAGTYRDAWYGDVNVTNTNGRLVMQFSHTPSLLGDLEHWQYETFYVRWRDRSLRADALVTFHMNANGQVESARMIPASPAVDFSFDFQDLDLKRVPEGK
jgi:CubicO group peptidase (beta-lactamase class C family)